MADAFGGSKSKQKSVSTSTSGPTDMTPDAFKDLQGPLADTLKSLTKSGVLSIPNYANSGGTDPSQFTAGITSNESDILDQLMADTNSGTRAQYLKDVIDGKYLATGQGQNPFLDAMATAANRNTIDSLASAVGKQIPSLFALSGQVLNPHAPNVNDLGSSAFAKAAGDAYRSAANAVGDTNAQIYGNAYNTERANQQAAVGLSQQEVTTTINNLQAQALPRLIEQYGLDQGLQEYQDRIQAMLQALQIAGGVAQPTIANQSQSSSTSTGTSTTKPDIVGTVLKPFSFGVTR